VKEEAVRKFVIKIAISALEALHFGAVVVVAAFGVPGLGPIMSGKSAGDLERF
jgi:hypothetical protein